MSKRTDVFSQVESTLPEIIQALPFQLDPEELARAQSQMKLAFQEHWRVLADCTRESIGKAMVLSTISGLFPGGKNPDVWLIPRKNRHKGGAVECNWQISFRGWVRLARRNGYDVWPALVFDGEEYAIGGGTSPSIQHDVDLRLDRGWDAIIGGYILAKPNEQRWQDAKFMALTKDQIQQRRAKAQDDRIWKEWPDEQSLKTLCSYGGARELWPMDERSRWTAAMDTTEYIGDENVIDIQPGQTRSSKLVQRLTAGPDDSLAWDVPEEPEREPVERKQAKSEPKGKAKKKAAKSGSGNLFEGTLDEQLQQAVEAEYDGDLDAAMMDVFGKDAPVSASKLTDDDKRKMLEEMG